MEADSSEQLPQLTGEQRLVRRVAALLFSAFYAWIPWYTWRPRSFKDITAYANQLDALRARSEELDFERLTSAEYIFSEPLWRQVLAFAGEFADKPSDALAIISFVAMALFTSYLFVRASPWLVAFFMFNPAVIDLVIAQTRSALAAAIVLTAITSKRKLLASALILAASLIHSLTFVLVFSFCVAKLLESQQHKFSHATLSGWALCIGMLLAVVLALGYAGVLEAVDDRRAYVEHTAGNTISYTAYWVLLAAALAMTPRMQNIVRWNDFYAIMMMSIPLIMTFFTVPAARLVPLCFPLIIESISARPKPVRTYLAMSLAAYQLLHYTYWLN